MIFQERLTVLFPAVEEAGGKLFPGNCGQRRLDAPDPSGARLSAPANPSFLLRSLRGWRRNMEGCVLLMIPGR